MGRVQACWVKPSICFGWYDTFRMMVLEKKILHFFDKNLVGIVQSLSLHSQTNKGTQKREFSSAGSEHLPYKQRVGGSNPSTPTTPEGSTK